MQIVSVNVGRPREVAWRGKTVRTSIFKAPVEGRVLVRRLNLAGDEQADLSVHGGPSKAVYGYPSEHYEAWREELGLAELPFGAFGENLTTRGLVEDELFIGDELEVGEARLRVTEPRVPCYKLGLRFGRADMVRRFLAAGRPGFYLAVLREGELGAGDAVAFAKRARHGFSVGEIARLHSGSSEDLERLARASELEELSEGWREMLRTRLERAREGG
jgi:MOSC domain-containing protein YiiM